MTPTQEIAQAVFDAHITTLYEMMQGQVTDIEAFNEWATKVASAMTSTTLAFMFPLKAEFDMSPLDETKLDQTWTDYESDAHEPLK